MLEEENILEEYNESINSEVNTENNTENEEVEIKKEEFKPWKNKVPETIPYSRFSEVNSEKKAAIERAELLEKELSEFRKSQEKVKQVHSVDDLKLEDFENFNDYQRALIEVAHKEFRKEMEKESENKRVQEIENNIMSEFSNRVSKAVSENPEINDAVEYISQFAQHIPAQTRYSLLVDENSPEVIYEIATTPGMLESIIKMNPLDAARKIARMSSKYDNKDDSSVNREIKNIPSSIPKTMTKATGTPNLKGSSMSNVKIKDTTSMSEYRKLRAQGKA
jgi:hypothetical protein